MFFRSGICCLVCDFWTETLISNKVNDSLEVASLGFIVAAFLWSKECVGKIPEPRGSKGPKDIFFVQSAGLLVLAEAP